ncbi:MAG: hypothetical protein V3S43_06365 [Acidimicrobiia bacterium]
MSFVKTSGLQFIDSPTVDAFARVRVCNPEAIFDSKQLFDDSPLMWDDAEVSGSGTTSAHSTDKALTQIGVALSTAGKRVRQTFRRFSYQPGKSQLIALTGILRNGSSGITQETGYFDDDNGVFFRVDDAVLSVVVKSSVSGSAVDTVIPQSAWNVDKLDGTGESGIALDLTKIQVFLIDFEWLGGGRVRFAFLINGAPIICHQVLHANLDGAVYMSTPNLPVRYSIENDGTGAASTLDHICATVISEGRVDDTGVLRHRSTAGTSVTMVVENTLYAILGLRFKSTHLDATIKLVKVAVSLQSASDDVEWVLIFDPTIAGSVTWIGMPNSALQYFIGATANVATGGTHIDAGYVATGVGASASNATTEKLENALLLGAKIDGTLQTIVLCARPINGSSTNVIVEGGITWRET